MSDINMGDGPIFVDVSNEQQFPSMFVQMINSQELAEIVSSSDTAPVKESSSILAKPSETTSQESSEAEKACIRIEKRPHKCNECLRYSAETEEKLIRHIRKVHRGENPFQCSMCEYSTYNKAVFEEHVRVHQGIKPYKCSFCDYSSASKKNAKKHELIHRKDNPNKCKDCDFIGRNPQSYKHHRSHVHKDGDDYDKDANEYICKDCKRGFPNKQKLRTHRINANTCKQCTFKVCSKKQFKEHVKQCKITDRVKLRKDLDKVFKCALCKWSSASKPRILLHLIHHPKQKIDEKLIDISILRNCGIMT